MKCLQVLASVCVLLTCRLVAAQNITVAQNDTGQFKSVQEAIMSVRRPANLSLFISVPGSIKS